MHYLFFLLFSIILFTPPTMAQTQQCAADREITISPDEGRAVAEALREAREMRRLDSLHAINSITIHLRPGTYFLNEPLFVRQEDSGITFQGEDGAYLSGGMKIEKWHREGQLWVADVPDFNGRPLEFRQLWVNGTKAVRARDVSDFEQMARIISVDKTQREIWVPAKAVKAVCDQPYAEMILH